MISAAFFNELEKLAKKKKAKLTKEKVLELARRKGVLINASTLDGMTEEQLARVVAYIKSQAASKKKTTKEKSAKSDIARAADRKKMLLGVKREKAILNVDYMKRVNKQNRLATKPFKGLKKEQREMRLGLTRGVRRQAKSGYGRK